MNANLITCPRCGERLPEGFTRCDACGAYLVPHPAGSAAPSAPGRKLNVAAGPRHAPARAGSSPWVYLVVGLIVGGAVGYALRSGVGTGSSGGAPKGPADVMAGAGAGEGGGMGAAPGGMGAGMAGGQMPPDIAAAVQKYNSALMMDPNDLQANIGLGNLEFDSQQWDRAIEHYTKALAKDPKNADVRVDRAIAYHSLGQDAKAKEEMLRVTKDHPEHRNAWLNLGVVSAATGDKPGAIKAWERYLQLEPSGTHSAAIRDELNQLKQSP
ncbi:MAG TPA: tetratricopeptide repeat protein [Candidatus Omnitrophota bacterium]|nr:tetratricopeptide repeat protein [Candidatus Omnitrophota bacterium]